ncbi:amidohydrolase [Pseudarthrobacter phenanthrenivorans]|uniref:amidohydrolase n=1 Tax=Pseudarthrobacter phenanthrenivorans TaxID=361575 RepID=UPI002F351531
MTITTSVRLTAAVDVPESFVNEYIDVYKHLHAHPELSGQEFETAAYIETHLAALGIDSFRCGATGVVAVLTNGDGPVVGFRADTDGLPIAEETGLEYSSEATGTQRDGTTVPVMHGCGHDTHVAAALALAALLVERRELWKGTLVLIFQPGEETAYGARAMISDGLWDRAPKPEVVLAQHVLPAVKGTLLIRSGHMATLADSWKVTVHGRQAHGSQPEKSVDPIVAASAMVLRLQTIVSRELAPSTPAVISVGTFHAGLKENIIPATAEFSINVRTPDEDTRAAVLAAIRRIISAEAAASAAPEPTITEINTFPRCYNDPEATRRVIEGFTTDFGADVVTDAPLGMASEDAGLLSDAIGVPGVYWAFGTFEPELFDGGASPAGNHSPFFAPEARSAVVVGTGAALSGVLAFLGRN